MFKPVKNMKVYEQVVDQIKEMVRVGQIKKGDKLPTERVMAEELQVSRIVWLNGERVDNPNTHGTGCTLSSAIAANLAQGLSIEESVKAAKEYLTGALKAGLNFGSGSGPLDHTYWLDINK